MTFIETPIFVKTLDDWLDGHDGHIPGDVEHAFAPTQSPEVSTPLMDDVEAHGVGPWDDKRRKTLGSATVNLVRKPARAPRQRRAKITKGSS